LRKKCTPASLPRCAEQDRGDRVLEPGVGVGDDQLHPGKAAGLQRAQERGPERAVLTVADLKAQHLPVPVGGDASGHDDGLGDHPVADPRLAVGGVQEHIREPLGGQAAILERGHFSVEVSADPADLALGDPAVGAQGLDQVVDLAGGGAVQIRLHDHREQRLVHPAAPLQQRREERPAAQLGDPQFQVPGGAGQHPRPVTVAVGSAGTGPLVWQRADHRAELGLDQGLVDRFGGLPDPVIDLSGLECLQDFQQCRLVQGHRVLSFRENHWRGLADHHTVASPACSGTPSGPITYTTGRDAACRVSRRPKVRTRLNGSGDGLGAYGSEGRVRAGSERAQINSHFRS
jgi:hypothetical protein